jgi:hypothetical protein
MTTTMPDAPQVDSTIKLITDNADRIFQWNYKRERPQLVTLYNKGMSSQWNSVTDLDWSTDVDPERLVAEQAHEDAFVAMARAAAKVKGSPFSKWTEKEFNQLGLEGTRLMLSQFMHGEQGAMMVAAKIVETVPWIDAKYYAATQTMDEARHTEVFARYLDEKLGEPYPMSPGLEAQIDALITDSRWDISYLGMQIVIESLALAAFGAMSNNVNEPLLKKLLRYVMADEARHVAFGILSLKEHYEELSDAEIKERQEFLAENTVRQRDRSVSPELFERVGVSLDEALPSMLEASQEIEQSAYTSFENGFFAKLVPNVRKLGLLDRNNGYLRQLWADAGLLKFEHADDTSEDYDSYDEVAKDRASATA